MFIPYRVDVPIRRWPIANFVILALLLICYVIERAQIPETYASLEPFVLAKGNLCLGLIGYIFLHGDILHLAGNMLFLWVFGNAVCVRVGNLAYPFIFLALGAVAGIAHLSLNGAPAIGASGAINGIVGMFLVWFPTNHISVFYIWFFGIGTFRDPKLLDDSALAGLRHSRRGPRMGRRGVLGAPGRIRGRVRSGHSPSQTRPGPDGAG